MCRCQQAHVDPQAHAAERGAALIWALFFVSLTTGVLIAHSIEMSANRHTMETRYRRVDIAHQVAESGLTDATAYLRRQPVQPVSDFAPQRDLGADPPVNDTIDPMIGLVREFEVHGRLWGRYEVRRDEALDVSAGYNEPPGSVWDLGARGILYEVSDPALPFDQSPNRIISINTVRTEVRGLGLTLPASATLLIDQPEQVQMLGNATVAGRDTTAVAYLKPTATQPLPVFDPNVTGSPVATQVAGLDLGVEALFGMREDQLRSFADVILYSPQQLRGKVVQDKAVYSPGSLTLDADGLSLRGRMLLFVDGDLTANEGNGSDFSGVVYVKNNAVLEGPLSFRGTMIVGGLAKIGGSSELVVIAHDAAEVAALQNALSQYRISRELRPSAAGGAYADTTQLWDYQIR